MSLEHQVALARTTRGESSHLSKAARQVVPPFLQKLYECADFTLTEVLGLTFSVFRIVNDPRNNELIRWSENGDSFYGACNTGRSLLWMP